MKEKHNIQLLIIDYLQLITTQSPYLVSENRPHDLSEITRMLKHISKELNIPIICLSQLSRKAEDRLGHRPMISDLRDCGAIEDHADIVMLLFRRDYYDPYDKPSQAEVIVAKNRHGSVGSIFLTYRKELAQFANFSYDYPQSNDESFVAFTP